MVFEHTDFSLSPIEQARRFYAGRYIDLASSNPTHHGLLFPPHILEDAARSYWHARSYDPHPRGLISARRALQAVYAQRTPAVALEADDFVITASTSEAYSHLFALLTAPGDNVLAPDITYPLFQYLAELHQVELRPYTLVLDDHSVAVDQSSLLHQADLRTRAVLVISPHNPTGHVWTTALPALSQLGLPVICDEVFASFPITVASVPAFATLHPELPVFQLNGLSKMLALPDLKLGWIALNPAARVYAERLELINDTFLSCSTLIQSMLPQLLAAAPPFQAAMLKRVKANIAYALQRSAVAPQIELAAPQGGYYLFPRIPHCDDDEQLVVDLLEYGVFVHPGYFYDYTVDCRLMLSCLPTEERFAQGFERLLQGLGELVESG